MINRRYSLRYSLLPLLGLAAVACGRAAGQVLPVQVPPPVQSPSVVQDVTITALPGARQTFAGLGASIFPWTPSAVYNAQVTPAHTRLMARLLWRDARFRSARLWFHPADYAPAPGQRRIAFCVDGYARTGKLPAALAAGATDLLLAPNEIPPYMGDGHGYINDADLPNYAALLADFIQDFKAHTGILFTAAGILNEPNDRPVRFRDAQWPVMVKDLRRALDARGLRQVEVVAPSPPTAARTPTPPWTRSEPTPLPGARWVGSPPTPITTRPPRTWRAARTASTTG